MTTLLYLSTQQFQHMHSNANAGTAVHGKTGHPHFLILEKCRSKTASTRVIFARDSVLLRSSIQRIRGARSSIGRFAKTVSPVDLIMTAETNFLFC